VSSNSSSTPDRRDGQVGITNSQISDLLGLGANTRALGGLSETELTSRGDSTKQGEALTDIVKVSSGEASRRLASQGLNPTGAAFGLNPFLGLNSREDARFDEVSTGRVESSFTAADVDNIIEAFGSRQEQIRARTESGGRSNSVLAGSLTSLLSGNTRSS